MSALSDAALAYALHGWPVFPLQPRGKDPLGRLAPHGYKNASRDPDTVRRWWAQCPDANIGIATGRGTGAWVLDLDCKNGARGLETYEALRGEPAIRDTLQQITGSGGKQLFFTLPGFDVPCFGQRSTARVGLDGCDIKGNGGYVAVPPSIHPDTAREYAWDGLEEFDRQPILDTPPVLLKALAKLIDAPESNQKAAPMSGAIPEGQRNDTLFRLACSLRGKNLSEAEIRAALLVANRDRCSPPLSEDEVRTIAASAGHYDPGPGNPRMIGVNPASAQTSEDALVLLNALTIWQGRLRWVGARRCGNTVICETSDGREVRFEAQHIMSFARCRTAIWSATGIVIPTPSRKDITPLWEQAVELIGKASMKDYQARGGSEDDTRLDLLRTFRGAGEPKPKDRDALFALLCAIQCYRREPYAELAPPAVFLWEGAVWVHPGTLKLWLGTITGGANRISVSDIREHLALLGFKPEALEKEKGDQRVKVFTWRGPAEVLDSE